MMGMIGNNPEAYRLLHEGTLAFGRAQQVGFRVDIDYCEKELKRTQRRMEYEKKKFDKTKFGRHWAHKMKNYNPASGTQLARMLYKVKKLEPPHMTKKENASVDEEALTELKEDVPELDHIIKLRRYHKIETYLSGMLREQVGGFIHPFFDLTIPNSYRSSSSNVNFQNFPKRDEEMMRIVRRAIMAHLGYQIAGADYANIEVRVGECYHHDPVMYEYIVDPANNMHRDLATQIFIMDHVDKKTPHGYFMYQGAKNSFVFPQFYGDYHGNNARGLWKWVKMEGRPKKGQVIHENSGIVLDNGQHIGAHLRSHGIDTYDKFVDHLAEIEYDFWNRRFKRYEEWKKEWIEEYNKKGYIEMLTGFRCVGDMTKNQLINLPIQGSAFHCLLWAFIEIDKELEKRKLKSRLLGEIHDELLINQHPKERNEVAEILTDVMTHRLPKHWDWIEVPLEVEGEICEVDGSWETKEEWNLAA
jgi:DNA polymerase-1